jgi:hypothetical protein
MNLRVFHIPDHGERMDGVSHRVTWNSGFLPSLYNPFWFYKKWAKDDRSYRAEIKSFGLVRHSWTGVVKVEFSYITWVWDPEYNQWSTI